MTLMSLKNLEERLSASGFIRIHRSFIVAKNAITAIAKNTLQIGELTIPVTDQYKEAFNDFIKDWV